MDVQVLITEVETILSAPFPASLQNLNRVLNCSVTVIETWAVVKPCQIRPLLSVLVSRTQSDPPAICILLQLSQSKDIFDILVRNHPTILERLCAQQLECITTQPLPSATTETDSQSPVSTTWKQACLFHLLPAGTAPSTSYYGIMEALLLGNESESMRSWQLRVYPVLADASLDTLSNLSETTISACANRWTHLLRSKDHLEALYASFLASRLQRHQSSIIRDASSMGSCLSINSGLRAWIEKCASIFKAEQATVTVKNTLARVLDIIRHEQYWELDGVVTAVHLAKSVLTVAIVSSDLAWGPESRALCSKLAQKLSTTPPSLQLAGLSILALADVSATLAGVLKALQQALRRIIDGLTDDRSGPEIVLRILHRCIESTQAMQPPIPLNIFFREVVNFIIEQSRPQDSRGASTTHSKQQALAFVRILQGSERPANATTSFLQAMIASGLPDWWALDLSSPGSPENCCGLPTCIHHEEALRQQLRDEISLLVLTKAASSGVQLPTHMVKVLTQQWPRRDGSEPKTWCTYNPFIAQQLLPTAPSNTEVTCSNWRIHLNESLALSSTNTAHLLEQIVTEMTKELQDRCDHVERPLQVAHVEANHLRECVGRLEGDLSAMASEKHDLRVKLDAEQQRIAEYEAASEALNTSNTALQQQLTESMKTADQARADLRAARLSHQEVLEETERNAEAGLRQAGWEYATKKSELESCLSSQARAKKDLEDNISWLKERMEESTGEYKAKVQGLQDRSKHEEAQLRQQIEGVKSELYSRVSEIEKLNDDIASKDETITVRDQQCKDAADRIASLETDLSVERERAGNLHAKLTEVTNGNDRLANELKNREAEVEEQTQHAAEAEASASHWRQRCAATEKALAEARTREEGIQALLGGGGGGGALTAVSKGAYNKPLLTNRRSTSAVLVRRSMQHVPAPAARSTHINGLVNSEDDTDYFEDEIVELEQ